MLRSELRQRSALWDEAALFAPIGGQKVGTETIEHLQRAVRMKADEAEADIDQPEAARRRFDFEVAVLLYDEMDLSPHEGSQLGVWAFLACVVLPDVVRWRFPGEGATPTRPDRFLGGARGLRNTFGRLWWRAFTLGDPNQVDRWHLMRDLLEDQAVAILERPTIAGYPPLARAVLDRPRASGINDRGISRQDSTRELSKRLRRLAAIVPLEAVSAADLDTYVDDVLAQVEESLTLGRSPREITGTPETTKDVVPARDSPPARQLQSTGPEPVSPATQQVTPPALVARLPASLLGAGSRAEVLEIPAALIGFLPSLNETYANPERNVFVVDDDGQRWLWRFVHYNRSTDQYVLAGLSPFLEARAGRPGDWLRLTVGEDSALHAELLRDEGRPHLVSGNPRETTDGARPK